MSSRSHTRKNTQATASKTTSSAAAVVPNTLSPSLQRAWVMIQKSDYAGAVNLLASSGREPQVRNALGVCLLRLGRAENAVDVYRGFVLSPGSVMERPDVSNACKRNFATALLMQGFPSGALAVLAETREPDHLMAVRIRSAIRQWEASLSWLRRLDWKWNAVEPRDCHIPLDFEPGEFDWDVQRQRPVDPDKPNRSQPKIAA